MRKAFNLSDILVEFQVTYDGVASDFKMKLKENKLYQISCVYRL